MVAMDKVHVTYINQNVKCRAKWDLDPTVLDRFWYREEKNIGEYTVKRQFSESTSYFAANLNK